MICKVDYIMTYRVRIMSQKSGFGNFYLKKYLIHVHKLHCVHWKTLCNIIINMLCALCIPVHGVYAIYLLWQESMFQPTSPKRRESTPLLERMKVDVAAARAKIMAALEKKDSFKKVQVKKDTLPVLKYLNNHVSYFNNDDYFCCFSK